MQSKFDKHRKEVQKKRMIKRRYKIEQRKYKHPILWNVLYFVCDFSYLIFDVICMLISVLDFDNFDDSGD